MEYGGWIRIKHERESKVKGRGYQVERDKSIDARAWVHYICMTSSR